MNLFFKNHGPFEINYILNKINFSKKNIIKKNKIKNISNLFDAKKGDISFFDNMKYVQDLKNTQASFCLIKENHTKYLNSKTIALTTPNPLNDFILISKLFYPEASRDNFKFVKNNKFKNNFIDKTVKIGKNFSVGINTVIKRNVIIGNNVTIGSNCVISNSIIGDSAIINDGTIIGKIGFGFKFIKNKIKFIPHIGHVEVSKNVYIGSNCSIDRGSFSVTSIGSNTMIDNQVHIAHNVKIGSFCIIAGQVGVAGSTQIGDKCMIGGQTGISGHLKIGNNVHIGGNSGVLKNVNDNSKIMGYPADQIKNFLKKS